MQLRGSEVIPVMDSILSAYSTLAVLGLFAALLGAFVTAAADSTPPTRQP